MNPCANCAGMCDLFRHMMTFGVQDAGSEFTVEITVEFTV